VKYHGNLVPSVRRLAVGAVEASEKDGMRVCRTDERTEPNPGSKISPSWHVDSASVNKCASMKFDLWLAEKKRKGTTSQAQLEPVLLQHGGRVDIDGVDLGNGTPRDLGEQLDSISSYPSLSMFGWGCVVGGVPFGLIIGCACQPPAVPGTSVAATSVLRLEKYYELTYYSMSLSVKEDRRTCAREY